MSVKKQYGWKELNSKPKTYWRFVIYVLILISFWFFIDLQKARSESYAVLNKITIETHNLFIDNIRLERDNPYNNY